MVSPIQVEEAYRNFMGDFPKSAPDGVIQVDLRFLNEAGLLRSFHEPETQESITQYFQVIESAEKVTLMGEQFVIWIVPRVEKEIPTTTVLIALAHQNQIHLEIAFRTWGVYNTPRHVLQVLQHFLSDVIETEATLLAMEKSQ